MSEQDLKTTVRRAYAEIALTGGDCCDGLCCGGATATYAAKAVGYSDEELARVPDGSNMGLGCGNPLALASLSEGDVVLDLGSGGGFDCFLAAARVGSTGRAIGVDMTPEMLTLARSNAEQAGYDNVEFRLGELEALPVADATVDLVISNCVINLVPDRASVYAEAFRVLKPGGRIVVSDTIQTAKLPQAFLDTEVAKAACISAEVTREDYLASITDAGFVDVSVDEQAAYPKELGFENALAEGLKSGHGIPTEVIQLAARSMVSMSVSARKPL
jgi:arsenite methyltransferase